jgi:hypothetical protein
MAGYQEFWHGSLRPGNAAASAEAVPFLQVCLAKIPTQEWIPNVAFFQMLLLGFNLVHHFKRP